MWGRSLLLFLLATPALAGAPKPTRFSWSFENIVEGYDHVHQILITVDGMEVAASDPGNESVPGSLSVQLPEGAQTVRVVSLAQYEGLWEEHTIENDYAVDCVWEFDVDRRPPKKVDLVCDIDVGPRMRVR